jgi:hypothetical protein
MAATSQPGNPEEKRPAEETGWGNISYTSQVYCPPQNQCKQAGIEPPNNSWSACGICFVPMLNLLRLAAWLTRAQQSDGQ